jgi:hypothetical protein
MTGPDSTTRTPLVCGSDLRKSPGKTGQIVKQKKFLDKVLENLYQYKI